MINFKRSTNAEVELDTIISRNKDIDASDLDGEMVMMDLDKGQYFMMNEVGSAIWELLEEPMSVSDVVERLLVEYEVDENTCRDTVLTFVNELKRAELLVVA